MCRQRTATHPGEILQKEMERRGLKKMAFAKQLNIANSRFSDIIHGKREITVDIAHRLEQILGFPAGYWIELQEVYDQCYPSDITTFY